MCLAHSRNLAGRSQPLAEHLRSVAQLASSYASAYDASDEAYLAGVLHDVGKYGDLFQLRLKGQASHIDHWSPGAWMALKRHRNLAIALAIHGHHIGLLDPLSLREIDPAKASTAHPLGLRLSETDTDLLLHRMSADGIGELAPAEAGTYGPRLRDTASAMLDARMLYSALVDADFLDTEAHFDGASVGDARHPTDGAPLSAGRALSAVLGHISGLTKTAAAAGEVMRMRADLLDACLTAAPRPPGLWTLSAPTGAGKTLAMLAFALRHAMEHDLRRVVIVIPYLSIIEQTARIMNGVLDPHFGAGYLREHHSMAGTGREADYVQGGESDGDNERHRRLNALAENWRAPIIITTSVQLLESLFSNRPSACRKLHRLARSVILFDEVQTIPDHLAVPTLATLSWLVERYRTSVVFATATQPAFGHFDKSVRAIGDSGWRPREIVSPDLRLFGRVCRTHVAWPDLDSSTSWAETAAELAGTPQALCIVNIKRHARELFLLLQELGAEGILHLSTAMCPAHRRAVLRLARCRLRRGLPCHLVSTQCIEAGVDIDFPVVYRALGPLEAVAQAAGRCNRNGRWPRGEVRVFLPEPDGHRLYPSGAYEQATDVTRMLLRERGPCAMDINKPGLFEEYYQRFYSLVRSEEKRPELKKAIIRQDFAEVARLYRLIDQDTINVLVPYKREVYEVLAEEVRQKGLTADWTRRAQPYSIGIFRPEDGRPVWGWLERVPLARRAYSDEWFIHTNPDDYKQTLGLDEPSVLMA